jgi:hypothetical protein
MSWNKNEKKEIIKAAEDKGYQWNSAGTKMINEQGKSLSFSSTGNSGSLNGTHYSSASDIKKSTKW